MEISYFNLGDFRIRSEISEHAAMFFTDEGKCIAFSTKDSAIIYSIDDQSLFDALITDLVHSIKRKDLNVTVTIEDST